MVLEARKVKLVNQQEDFLVSLVNRALPVFLANQVNPVCLDHLVKWVREVRQEDLEKSVPLVRMDRKEQQVSLEKRRSDTLAQRATRALTVFRANKDREDFRANQASRVKLLSALKVYVVLTVFLEKMANKDQKDSLVLWD